MKGLGHTLTRQPSPFPSPPDDQPERDHRTQQNHPEDVLEDEAHRLDEPLRPKPRLRRDGVRLGSANRSNRHTAKRQQRTDRQIPSRNPRPRGPTPVRTRIQTTTGERHERKPQKPPARLVVHPSVHRQTLAVQFRRVDRVVGSASPKARTAARATHSSSSCVARISARSASGDCGIRTPSVAKTSRRTPPDSKGLFNTPRRAATLSAGSGRLSLSAKTANSRTTSRSSRNVSTVRASARVLPGCCPGRPPTTPRRPGSPAHPRCFRNDAPTPVRQALRCEPTLNRLTSSIPSPKCPRFARAIPERRPPPQVQSFQVPPWPGRGPKSHCPSAPVPFCAPQPGTDWASDSCGIISARAP